MTDEQHAIQLLTAYRLRLARERLAQQRARLPEGAPVRCSDGVVGHVNSVCARSDGQIIVGVQRYKSTPASYYPEQVTPLVELAAVKA